LSPRSVVTEKVILSARPPVTAPTSAPATASPAPESSQQAAVPVEAGSNAAEGKPGARLDMLRLATEITTPIPAVPRPRRPVDKETVAALGRAAGIEAVTKAAPAPALRRPEAGSPQAAIGARIDRRDTTSVRDKAEGEFRRAVGLVNQGRVAEGMEAFRLALQIDPAHDSARQTMVALQIESKRYDDAAQTLDEGIVASPKNIQFVMLLARLQVERNDAAGALALLDRHEASAAGKADFSAFRAALLQRMGRHAEAIEAYRASLAIAPGTGQWWIGLGISQQAQAQGKDALESFRRARGAGNLTPELLSYVEQRIRQLQN
ncbi:MAG: tetratricopeptide repeat protein, partial [Sulfuricaulis sp.]|nr:tetratricopeptide repeat protein [Sulfuricaulis sp.]